MADLGEIADRQRAAAVDVYRSGKLLPDKLMRLLHEDVPVLISEIRFLREVSGANCQEHCCTQRTNCARCGKHKHTPLRRDEMGGYVCLTCVDQMLDSLSELAEKWSEFAKTAANGAADAGAYAATANCADVLKQVLGGCE